MNQDESENTWTPENDFDSTEIIEEYWANLVQPAEVVSLALVQPLEVARPALIQPLEIVSLAVQSKRVRFSDICLKECEAVRPLPAEIVSLAVQSKKGEVFGPLPQRV